MVFDMLVDMLRFGMWRVNIVMIVVRFVNIIYRRSFLIL